MSSHAASAEPRALTRRLALPRVAAGPLATLGFAALLAAVALEGSGGLQLGSLTTVEIALELLAGAAGAAAFLLAPADRRPHGLLALVLFGVLLAFTAASITWAIDPDDAWIEANRTLAWLAAFVLGFAIVRTWPEQWGAPIAGFVLAAVVVCGYAVLTKIFPGALNPDELVARLREPFGYWNSVGLMAAMAGPGCLWLGARRSGHAAVNALAYPAFALLVVALLLAYSRGALLALAVGCAFWFAVVPLRLRGFAVLAAGGLGGTIVGLWAFSQDALSKDQIALDARIAGGQRLGILLVAMLLVLLIVGLAVGFALAERAPSRAARRHAGLAALVAVALVPVAVVGMLATSERGLTGSISNGWHNLTDVNGAVPHNDPTRLAAVGSVRARYWDEALKIWRREEALGVGAGGYRTARPQVRQDTLNVRHAHGYVVQTLSDLGLVGLLVNLALLGAWVAAAVVATGPWRGRRRAAFPPERIGLLTMVAVVLVFGVHSTIDWTWIVPGNVVPALLLAGWVAGRGAPAAAATLLRSGSGATALALPAGGAARLRAGVRDPRRVAGALAAVALALVAAWTTWQPERSVNAADDALEAVEANRLTDARADVARARSADPLAVEPLYAGATIEQRAGNTAAARKLYEAAVGKEPSSSETWLRLAQFELDQGRPRASLRAIGPALHLDPRSVPIQVTWLLASRAETQRRAAAVAAKKRRAERRRARRGG